MTEWESKISELVSFATKEFADWRDFWQAAADAGLFCCNVPEEFGGLGLSARQVIETMVLLGKTTTDAALPMGVNSQIWDGPGTASGLWKRYPEGSLSAQALVRRDGDRVCLDRGGRGLGRPEPGHHRYTRRRHVSSQWRQVFDWPGDRVRPCVGLRLDRAREEVLGNLGVSGREIRYRLPAWP